MAMPTVAQQTVDSAQEIDAARAAGATLQRPTNPSDLTKVRVRVRETAGEITIVCSHAPGSVENIMTHLPTLKMVQRVRSSQQYYAENLRGCIKRLGSAIPREVWAKAIAAEIIMRLGERPEADIEMSAVAKGGYLALESGVYRLTAVECSPLNRAASAIRRRTLEKAEVEASAIKESNKRQCDALLAEASEKLRQASAKKAEIEASAGRVPPKWATDYKIPLRFVSYKWHIGILTAMPISQFVYEWKPNPAITNKKTWNAVPVTYYPNFLLWVPIEEDGSFNQRAIYIDEAHRVALPHITTSSGCMAIAQSPARLQNHTHVNSLRDALVRTMAVIQLNSLYGQATYWPRPMIDQLPTSIKDIVRDNLMNSLRLDTVVADRQTSITVEQEGQETWTSDPANAPVEL